MNKTIHRDTETSTSIFDHRSLERDYATLVPLLSKGLRVLDVGCGTGAISKDIARRVGPNGAVLGIDNTEAFVMSGRQTYGDVTNLQLICSDLFTFRPAEQFDLVVAARVLQWISDIPRAMDVLRSFLKPGGILSVLDYNHEILEWQPEPPQSMRKFYHAFLSWRAHAGMDNCVAENLPDYFKQAGFQSVEVYNADEVYTKGQPDFIERMGIWSKVAGLKQIVDEGFIDEEGQTKAVSEYDYWIRSGATSMTMHLKEIRSRK